MLSVIELAKAARELKISAVLTVCVCLCVRFCVSNPAGGHTGAHIQHSATQKRKSTHTSAHLNK